MAGSATDRPEGEGARTDSGAALTAFLADTPDARCPSCGYVLAGVTLARCPECGMPLDVELVRDGPARAQQPARDTDPHIDWWAIGLALAAPLLVGAAVLLLAGLIRALS